MADQIKPRYRLGTQNMLDLAKDDATKIPERTLFKVVVPVGVAEASALQFGDIVIRDCDELDDQKSVSMKSVDGKRQHFMRARRLQPLI